MRLAEGFGREAVPNTKGLCLKSLGHFAAPAPTGFAKYFHQKFYIIKLSPTKFNWHTIDTDYIAILISDENLYFLEIFFETQDPVENKIPYL